METNVNEPSLSGETDDQKNQIKPEPDYCEEGEKIPIGSIISTYAHPFTEFNTGVLITNYAHFTPPLMVVAEKKYGAKYNVITGEEEDNDSYKCIYYSTLNGEITENWFKRKEIKLVNKGDNSFLKAHKDKSLAQLKKDFFGEMAVLSNVDLELGKQKMWSDSERDFTKLKVNNLLDFLPPLGTIVDFKANEDYQKYSEKDRKISHRKSKVMVKLRWLNNITAKYSEEYFPMVALKLIRKEALELKKYGVSLYYETQNKIELEDSKLFVAKTPLKFHDVIWKHYFYIYRFKDLFTGKLHDFKFNQLQDITQVERVNPNTLESIFNGTDFQYKQVLGFFKVEKRTNFEGKWFEIEYSDKNERYSKRIIYIDELISEKAEGDKPSDKDRLLIKANCLLRNGAIRHFNISRIKSYRRVPDEFVEYFVPKK